MSKLEIVRLGHPKLRRKSLAVTKRELKTKRFQDFIDDLCAICDANNGAGIAAPQVGVNKRVIVVHVDPKNPRYPGKEALSADCGHQPPDNQAFENTGRRLGGGPIGEPACKKFLVPIVVPSRA